MTNGKAAWCDFKQEDWKDLIHPDENEVGVFLRGSYNLPYEPRVPTAAPAPGPSRTSETASSKSRSNARPTASPPMVSR